MSPEALAALAKRLTVACEHAMENGFYIDRACTPNDWGSVCPLGAAILFERGCDASHPSAATAQALLPGVSFEVANAFALAFDGVPVSRKADKEASELGRRFRLWYAGAP